MSRPSVVVLDYGSGNLHSVTRALLATGAEVALSADPAAALAADGLVVPGVGSYATCMSGLAEVEAAQVITKRLAAERPTLGICVGHQVMFSEGIEHGQLTVGLGLLPGEVERLSARRLPHMGWNSVRTHGPSTLFADGVLAERFYFVHSYAVRDLTALQALEPAATVTTTSHEGETFVAGVEWRSLSCVQVHPEKSGEAGARLLRRWVAHFGMPA